MDSIFKLMESFDDEYADNTKKLHEKVKNGPDKIVTYIHDEFGYYVDDIGLDGDNIFFHLDVDEDDNVDQVLEDIGESIVDKFGNAYDIKLTSLPDDDGYYTIEIDMDTELSSDSYISFVEPSIYYEERAKFAEIEQQSDGSILFKWCSQEDMDEECAGNIGALTNEYLVERGYVGVNVSGECYCRDTPKDVFPITFTTYPDLTSDDIDINVAYGWLLTDEKTGYTKTFDDLSDYDVSEVHSILMDRCKEIQQILIDDDLEEMIAVTMYYGRLSALPDKYEDNITFTVTQDEIDEDPWGY